MPSEFQVNTLNAMLARMDALVLAPTGQGKSLIYETGIALKRMENPKSVLLLCLPLTSVMEEKSKKPVLPTAFITMAGKIVVNEDGEEVEDAEVPADLMESVLQGEYAIVMGHAESFLSPTGRKLLKSLKKKNMISIMCIDELHKFLRWKMRPSMQVSKNTGFFHSPEFRRCHRCSGRWGRRRGASTSLPPSPRPTSRWPRICSA
jgi:superfamily II DNA helicase RecQ